MSEARAKIVEIIAEQLYWTPIQVEQAVERGKTFTDIGFDSLDCVEVLMTIEDVFDIEIDETEPEFADGEAMKVGHFLGLILPAAERAS